MPPIVARPDAAASALEILEQRFAEVEIRKSVYPCNRTKPGVYLLISDDRVVYVGSTEYRDSRIATHARDRAGWVAPRRALWLQRSTKSSARQCEGALIRLLWPPFNRQAPGHGYLDNSTLRGLGIPPHDDAVLNARRWADECGVRTHFYGRNRVRSAEESA